MATLVVGANSGIGRAVIELALAAGESVLAVSRQSLPVAHPKLQHFCGGADENEIISLIKELAAQSPVIDRVVIALGVLHQTHEPAVFPEKRLEEVASAQWQHSFFVNTVLPGVWVSRLLPLLKGEQPCVMSVAPEKLFTPQFVAGQLQEIMQSQPADGTLSYLDWQGQPIPW